MKVSVEVQKIIKFTIYIYIYIYIYITLGRCVDGVLVRLPLIKQIIKDANSV